MAPLSKFLTPNRIWLVHIIWLIAMVAVVLMGGVRHDYSSYLKQWALVMSSRNPWTTNNAYGPIHNLLAYTTVFGTLGPKVLMCGSFAVIDSYLLSRILRTLDKYPGSIAIYALAIPFNGVITYMGFFYGLNDILVASFVMAAVLARLERKFYLSGVLIGAAALTKYYPLLLLPFLMFDDKHIRMRPALSALSIFFIGIGISWLVWGDSVFTPLFFGSKRDPKLLSIVASLRAHPWLIGGKRSVRWLIRHDTIVVLTVASLVTCLCWRNGISWLASFVTGTLAVLLSYKVGHPQFYMTWLSVLAALPLTASKRDYQTAWMCVPFAVFLTVFQTIYIFYDHMFGRWQVFRDNVGFVVFAIGIATILAVMHIHRDVPKRSLAIAW